MRIVQKVRVVSCLFAGALFGQGVVAAALEAPPENAPLGSAGDTVTNEGHAVSDAGRYMVFSSYANNLVPDDNNGRQDVFVWDRQLDTVRIVSSAADGQPANGDSASAVISADGQWVAFVSTATNLLGSQTTDANGASEDVFVVNIAAQPATVRLASVDSDTVQSTSASSNPDISANGRYITFDTAAALEAMASGTVRNVYQRDLWNNSTRLISQTNSGAEPNGESYDAQQSADGTRIVFVSAASDLSAQGVVQQNVFLRDLNSGQTSLVSVTNAGDGADGTAYFPGISGNGRYVAFHSFAHNLVDADAPDIADVIVRDMDSGEFELVSQSSSSIAANNHSTHPSLNFDGSVIAFRSSADNLVGGDNEGFGDTFVRDRSAQTTVRLSELAGVGGNNESWAPSVSYDGRGVGFWTSSNNLSPGGGSAFGDALFADLQTPATVPALATSVLPSSRSTTIGGMLTVFASVIATSLATDCELVLGPGVAAQLSWYATDPATNATVSAVNARFGLLPGVAQSLLLVLSPNEALAAREVGFDVVCSASTAAPLIAGVNTVLVTAEVSQPPDVVALAATVGNTGVVELAAADGSGFFSIATVNIGTGADMMVRPVASGVALNSLTICQTNPVSGTCLAPPAAAVNVNIANDATPTFSVFAQNDAPVAFEPASNRLIVQFEDAGGVVRGRTSVAVRSNTL